MSVVAGLLVNNRSWERSWRKMAASLRLSPMGKPCGKSGFEGTYRGRPLRIEIHARSEAKNLSVDTKISLRLEDVPHLLAEVRRQNLPQRSYFNVRRIGFS